VAVEIGSNKLVNDIFEAKLGATTSKQLKPHPQADLPMRLSYIKEKYQNRAYLDLEVLAIVVLKKIGDEKSNQAALLRQRLEYGDMDDNRPVSQRSSPGGWKEERSLSFHLVSETEDLNIFHGMSQVDLFSDSKKDMFCDMSAAGESTTQWLHDPQLSNSSLLLTARDEIMFVGGSFSYGSRRNVKLVDDVKDQSPALTNNDGSLEKNRKGSRKKGSRKKDDAMNSKKSKSIDSSSDKSAGDKEKKRAKHLKLPKVVTPEEIMAVLKGTATHLKGTRATRSSSSIIKGKANIVAKKRSKRTKSKERV
jgi:hypothetical protein